MKKIFFLIPVLLVVVSLSSCKEAGYRETESGLTYKFHEKNRGTNPSIDNIVKIDFAYRYPEDSVFFHSGINQTRGYVRILPSEYPGDIYEALRMMTKGDSASFRFDASRFFTITMDTPMVPDFIDPSDSIFVDIIMYDFFDEAGYEAYRQRQREEQIKEQEMAAHNETQKLDQYLAENNIDVEPEESGLIIIIEEEGRGEKPTSGQTVQVHYTGMLLDGTVFDSSVERGTPFEFQLGRGQVIRGWDEGISKIRVGSRARLIIPSYLGYSDRARGPVIQPYSTLIFDIELMDAY